MKTENSNTFRINERDYNKLISAAAEEEVRMRSIDRGNNLPALQRFLYRYQVPTVNDLIKANIGPHEGSLMSKDILLYLVYYGEQMPVGKDADGEVIYDYIFRPNPSIMNKKEMKDFAETRKYIEKTIQKRVEIIFDK